MQERREGIKVKVWRTGEIRLQRKINGKADIGILFQHGLGHLKDENA